MPPSEPTPNDNSPLIIGPYTILKPLGSGGVGRVYLGEDLQGRRAAVKVLDPADRKMFEPGRFHREVGILRQDLGDAIVSYLDDDLEPEDGSDPWIATEYISDTTLLKHVRTLGKLSSRALATMGMHLCEGLAHLHENGIAHRDVKPANIMIRSTGTPVFIDLGVAYREPKRTGVGPTHKTTANVVVGTDGFRAPEILSGDRSDFAAADIYSLGVTIVFAGTRLMPGEEGFADRVGLLDGAGDPNPLDESARDELLGIIRDMTGSERSRRPTALEAADRFASVVTHRRQLKRNEKAMESELVASVDLADRRSTKVPPSRARAREAARRIREEYGSTGMNAS